MEIGLCEDYPEESRTLAAARRDLQEVDRSGAKVLRIAFGWDAMEPEKGKYDWSFWDDYVREAVETHGIRLIPYVCYTPKWAASDQGEDYWHSPPRDPKDFGDFVAQLVRRYRPWIHSWELWNEPDNTAYWLGTPAQLAALVRAGSAAVRREDPDAKVVLGGLAGKLDYLEELLRDEQIAPAVDIVNFHSYFETWHPDPMERLAGEITRASQLVTEFGEREPIWLAEIGYSTVGPREKTSDVYQPHFRDEHTESAQANAIVRAAVLAAASEKLELFAWYRINDLPAVQDVIGDDNNRHLGVVTLEGHPKQGLQTLSELAAWFRQPYRSLPLRIRSVNAEGIEAHGFEFSSGARLIFAWLRMPGSNASGAAVIDDSREATVEIELPRDAKVSAAAGESLGGGRSPEVTLSRAKESTTLSVALRGSQVTALRLISIR
jgi:Cellulase (glycosyl hydrolase family 5)